MPFPDNPFLKEGPWSYDPLLNEPHSEQDKKQHERMWDDIEKYGRENIGEYRGIHWKVRRPHNTYLCGYVLYEGDVSEEKMEELERIAHGGLTAYLGFDCSHFGDYSEFHFTEEFDRNSPYGLIAKGKYRDYEYVVSILKQMIDCIKN